ncbi:hypothetical protein [Planktothricoides sp. SR001]|nr:hypothetical protein [Planktothricoides sp. SR001]
MTQINYLYSRRNAPYKLKQPSKETGLETGFLKETRFLDWVTKMV